MKEESENMLSNLSRNAVQVLEARYLRRNAEGRIIETPEQLFERVAFAVAYGELQAGSIRDAEFWREEFYRMLSSLDFLPNSPTLMNAGTRLGQLSGCFVLPVEDTMAGIFEAVKQMALVQQTGGGTGFSFSRLRPKGDVVNSTGGDASGPVSFMKIFDSATENIKQGGKRRGANMGILRVDHPDILEFATSKLDGTMFRNFNISVGVTDAFMEAVTRGDDYDLIDPRTGLPRGRISARTVFDTIVESAWKSGDPGLVFLDTINRTQPTPNYGRIEATNPCGEIPLLPYESCNLGSINLSRMIRTEQGRAVPDWEKLRDTVVKAVRFLDDVITVNKYSLPEIERMSHGNRKIGLGVMGFADMLIHVGVSYDSDDAVALGGRIMRAISEEAMKASQRLADERGAFPNWRGSIYEGRSIKVRNATRTAVAPTGTISIIADASAGIEPHFALAYRRSHVLEDQTMLEVNPVMAEYFDRHGLKTDEIIGAIFESGNLRDVRGVPDEVKRLFVTALEIPVERHLQIQAAFQRHVDNSVSKTINLPEEATPKDVAHAYLKAWDLGLKGITIYRYGSKSEQVLELGVDEVEPHHYPPSRCGDGGCRT